MKSWKALLALVLTMAVMMLSASLPAMAANSSNAELRAIREITKECKAAGLQKGTQDFQDCVSAGGPFSDGSPDTSGDNIGDSGSS
ncbi:MAG: hypothetical protein JOZ19_11420 [Rubrobacter sp.]|nr:hypothetical protein [Rubrobacter sp.]